MWMAKFNKRLGDKVDSAAMKATATDSLSDCISTTVVLLGVLITQFSNVDIDGYAGAFVALFVIIAGFKAAKEAAIKGICKGAGKINIRGRTYHRCPRFNRS